MSPKDERYVSRAEQRIMQRLEKSSQPKPKRKLWLIWRRRAR